jgi:hypothetical protein
MLQKETVDSMVLADAQGATLPVEAPWEGSVRPFQEKPTIHINGQPVPPFLYAQTDIPAARSWNEQPRRNLANFAALGVRLYQVDVCLAHCWRKPDEFSIELARRQVAGVLAVCPDAAVFIRVHVNPPHWWMKANPDEMVGYATGEAEDEGEVERLITRDMDRVVRVSLASDKWREELGGIFTRFCQELARSPEGKRVVGLHLACGAYGEWHYWGVYHGPDTGPAMTRHFRSWLASKYRSDDALKKAWGRPEAMLKAATVPAHADRIGTSHGIFRDPAREQWLLDYFKCLQEVVADDVLYFCRLAKTHWPRPLITGTFYAYFMYVGTESATGGHLEIERLQASPDVDYFSAPSSYYKECRDVGGTGQPRGFPASARLHGKLWLVEMDQPPVGGRERIGGDPEQHGDSIAQMRRNVMGTFHQGMGLWYYDFGPGKPVVDVTRCSGWWDHPTLLAEVRRLKLLFDERFDRPFEPVADVAVLYDTQVYYHLAPQEKVNVVDRDVVDRLSAAICRSGVIADTFYLTDMEKIDWSRYRAVVLANAYVLSSGQRRFLREQVARNGRHLLWMYAPGFSDGEQIGEDMIGQATGIGVSHSEAPYARIQIDAAGLPAVQYEFRVPNPLFAVSDPAALAVGRFVGSRDVAVARKDSADAVSWFFAMPPCVPGVLREVFRQAGAHVYSDCDDVVLGGGGLLTVHTLDGGPRHLRLRSGKVNEVTLSPRSTTVFDAESGQVVLA